MYPGNRGAKEKTIQFFRTGTARKHNKVFLNIWKILKEN